LDNPVFFDFNVTLVPESDFLDEAVDLVDLVDLDVPVLDLDVPDLVLVDLEL
jgi:hypothetical protein